MDIPTILEPFVEGSPLTVMVRAALEWLVDGVVIEQVFEKSAAS